MAHLSQSSVDSDLPKEGFLDEAPLKQFLRRRRLRFWFIFLLNFQDLLKRILSKCATFKTWNLETEEKQFADFLALTESLFPGEQLSMWTGPRPSQPESPSESTDLPHSPVFCEEVVTLLEAHGIVAGLRQFESTLS